MVGHPKHVKKALDEKKSAEKDKKEAVWVGTRFVASVEGGATDGHKNAICKSSLTDTHRTYAFTGRPMRVLKTPYTMEWENERAEELKGYLKNGILPWYNDQEWEEAVDDKGFFEIYGKKTDRAVPKNIPAGLPHLSGQVAGAITEVLTCQQIVDSMVTEAGDIMNKHAAMVSKL